MTPRKHAIRIFYIWEFFNTIGLGRTLDACYKKAGEVCPNGYNIIDRASGTVAVPVSGGGIIAAPEYNLAIECK